MASPAYHVRQAILCLRYSPYAALVAAATVAIALGVSGSSLLIVRSLEAVIRSYGADARLTLFLSPNAKNGAALTVEAEKAAGPGSHAELVPPDVALKRLKHDLGEAGHALNDLVENPLPPTIEVRLSTVRLVRGDLRDVAAAAARLRIIPGVVEVDDGASFIDHLSRVLLAVRTIGTILFGIVIGVALFLVGNVVRLTVYARKDEIDIQRLVGATDGFIATPFILEGTFQGLGGGIVAAIMVRAGEVAGLPRIASAFGFGPELLPPQLPMSAVLGVVALGGLLGLVASLFSVLRFLRSAP